VRRGFTLIELLVVVAIIAVLVSILLPALARARQGAQAVQCLSQMRQIGMAMVQYANEYDDVYPPSLSTTNRTYDWFIATKYLKGNAMLCCPIDGRDRAVPPYPRSYAMNDQRFSTTTWNNPDNGIRVDVFISEPSVVVMLCEWFQGYCESSGFVVCWGANADPVYGFPAPFYYPAYHSGSGNYAWFDGHAGSVPASGMGTDYWSWDRLQR